MAETEERHVDEIGKAQDKMEATADEMSERGEQLDERIDGAKDTLAKAKADASVPTAAGDWEDTEPTDSTGEDAAGFDDPEDLDLDDEDLDDDDDKADEDED
jgi:phage shock protein A